MTLFQPKLLKPSEISTDNKGSATLVWGLEGSGKSHIAINSADVAPTLVYLNFDRDVSHLLSKYKGEEIIYEKFVVDPRPGGKARAKADCDKIEALTMWAYKKGNCVIAFDNVQNWRSLSNRAYLPEGEEKPIPRQYEQSNDHMRTVALLCEAAPSTHSVFTAPASPKWVGQQTKITEGGEDLLESKAWEGLDFAVQTSVYMFNQTHKKMVKPRPVEGSIEPDFRALIVTAKLRPIVQGLIIEQPTLGEILKRTR